MLSGPDAYAEMYDKTFRIVEDQSEIKQSLAFDVLSWIFYSKRILTTNELVHAIAIHTEATDLNQDNIYAMSTILDLCAGLVVEERNGSNVQLVHHTAKEFMRDRLPEWLSARSDKIARACVTYLSFDTFSDGACSSDQAYTERLVKNPFYDYATCYWGEHVRENRLQEDAMVMRLVSKQSNMAAGAQAKMSQMVRIQKSRSSQELLRGMKAGHLLARLGLHITLERLIKNGWHPDTKDEWGRTALYHAAMEDHVEVIEMLVRNNASINAQGGPYGNALRAASHQGHLNALKVLLHEGADVNLPAADSFFAIQLAIVMDRGDVVRLLIEKGAQINTTKPKVETPLITAIKHARRDIARILLENAADPNWGTSLGLDSSLVIACRLNRMNIARMLLEARAKIDEPSGEAAITPLAAAAEKGHIATLEVLLKHGPKVDLQVGNAKTTALLMVSERGFVNNARLLLNSHAFVNLPAGTRKMTPLIAAAEAGRIQVVKLLIERHADLDAKDTSWMSALHYAARKGHFEVVKVLVQAGASMSILDRAGRDAIMCASGHIRGRLRTYFPTTVQYLWDHLGDRSKEQRLYTASWLDRGDLIESLLGQGVNIDANGGYYGSPLYAAAFQGHRHAVHLLLAQSADVNRRGEDMKTPLIIATEFKFLDLVKRFISAGSDVNAVDSAGRTALHFAAGYAVHMDLWNCLVDAGCSLQILDNQGCGPLFYAKNCGCEHIVEDILRRLRAAGPADE